MKGKKCVRCGTLGPVHAAACRKCGYPGQKPVEQQELKLVAAHFDGPAYDPKADRDRLTGQIKRIYSLMADHQWRTYREIAVVTGDPEASISAQLRHLRKERFGSHTVNRRSRGDRGSGLWEYQLAS